MLFEKKKCKECGSTYDVVLATCPKCKHADEEFENYKIPTHLVWLPIWKQLTIFALGLIGLQIVSLILELIFYRFIDPESVSFLNVINSTRYAIIALAIGAVFIGSFSSLKNSFKKWYPYLIGIGGMIVIYVFDVAYGSIIKSVYPTTTDNGNQQAAVSLIQSYPIMSVLIIGLLGPVVEELTYRVGLFTFLRRVNRWLPYIVTCIVFALIHFSFGGTKDEMINELLNLPSYIFAGAVFCLLYDFFGLSASLTAHISNNLLSVLLTLLFSAISNGNS